MYIYIYNGSIYGLSHMRTMYGIFTYIWVFLKGQMLVNIPYMEHMGIFLGGFTYIYMYIYIYIYKYTGYIYIFITLYNYICIY